MIQIQIDQDVITDSLDKASARELVLHIDKRQHCCDWSIKTIKELITVLEQDMDRDDIAKELGFDQKEL
jgi:hypothetical protein